VKQSSIYQLVIVTIAVIILSLLYFFYPATDKSFYPKCIFHELTGFYCPGCGSQRAASALLHGQLLKAVDLNILFVLFVPLILYSGFVFTWNIFHERKMQQAIFYSPVFIRILLAVIIIFWIMRNIRIAPFNWLAP